MDKMPFNDLMHVQACAELLTC